MVMRAWGKRSASTATASISWHPDSTPLLSLKSAKPYRACAASARRAIVVGVSAFSQRKHNQSSSESERSSKAGRSCCDHQYRTGIPASGPHSAAGPLPAGQRPAPPGTVLIDPATPFPMLSPRVSWFAGRTSAGRVRLHRDRESAALWYSMSDCGRRERRPSGIVDRCYEEKHEHDQIMNSRSFLFGDQ